MGGDAIKRPASTHRCPMLGSEPDALTLRRATKALATRPTSSTIVTEAVRAVGQGVEIHHEHRLSHRHQRFATVAVFQGDQHHVRGDACSIAALEAFNPAMRPSVRQPSTSTSRSSSSHHVSRRGYPSILLAFDKMFAPAGTTVSLPGQKVAPRQRHRVPLTEITACLAACKRAYASRVALAADAVVRSPRR